MINVYQRFSLDILLTSSPMIQTRNPLIKCNVKFIALTGNGDVVSTALFDGVVGVDLYEKKMI